MCDHSDKMHEIMEQISTLMHAPLMIQFAAPCSKRIMVETKIKLIKEVVTTHYAKQHTINEAEADELYEWVEELGAKHV